MLSDLKVLNGTLFGIKVDIGAPPNGGRGAHVVHVIILLMTVWCMLGE